MEVMKLHRLVEWNAATYFGLISDYTPICMRIISNDMNEFCFSVVKKTSS